MLPAIQSVYRDIEHLDLTVLVGTRTREAGLRRFRSRRGAVDGGAHAAIERE